MEFLQSVGGFMQQVLPVAQAQPKMAPLLAEMLMFAVRSFKGGRSIEAVFDATMAELSQPQEPQQQQPDPAQMQMEAQMQVEQAKLQAEQQRTQTDAQLQQMKVQSDQTMAQMKLQSDREIAQFKAQTEMQLEQMRQAAETERAEMRARIEAEAKVQIAAMQMAGEQNQAIAGDQAAAAVAETTAGVSQAMQMLAEAVGKMNKPKRRELVRGPDGRAAGVIEIEME